MCFESVFQSNMLVKFDIRRSFDKFSKFAILSCIMGVALKSSEDILCLQPDEEDQKHS